MGYLATGEIFENMLQLKGFGLYFEGIMSIFLSCSFKNSHIENCKYLGITISTKNSDLDLKRQMRKIYANANLLLRKFFVALLV